jgi:hypothetical protein
MPQINLMISGHPLPANMIAPPVLARPFQPRRIAEDEMRLAKLRAAMRYIERVVVHGTPGSTIPGSCNAAFEALPGLRPFSDVWHDPNVWISFSMDPVDVHYGWSFEFGRDVAITHAAFSRSWTFVAATLVHELAHINGAPGPPSRAAEDTLRHCGFEWQRDPTVVGQFGPTEPAPQAARFS